MRLERHRLRDFDWFLAATAVLIAAFGTWQIYNAQPEMKAGEPTKPKAKKQG